MMCDVYLYGSIQLKNIYCIHGKIGEDYLFCGLEVHVMSRPIQSTGILSYLHNIIAHSDL